MKQNKTGLRQRAPRRFMGLYLAAIAMAVLGSTLHAGMVGLGDLPGGGPELNSTAYDITPDGLFIVGFGSGENNPRGAGTEAVRWRMSASGSVLALEPLGDLPGGDFNSEARAVSADGTVAVGIGAGAGGSEAIRWTDGVGMESVRELLITGGVDMTGWTLTQATGISDNGTKIVGNGTNPDGVSQAWVVDLSSTVTAFTPLTPNGAGETSLADEISNDGNVIVGTSGSSGIRWAADGTILTVLPVAPPPTPPDRRPGTPGSEKQFPSNQNLPEWPCHLYPCPYSHITNTRRNTPCELHSA